MTVLRGDEYEGLQDKVAELEDLLEELSEKSEDTIESLKNDLFAANLKIHKILQAIHEINTSTKL